MKKIQENKKIILLIIILLLASFLRLYRVEDYMVFLGDEGRDVLVSLHMLQGKIPFLGPRVSAGDFFLGPMYYYFMTPFLWLFHYDPVGPAIMVSLFGVATVYLIYFVGKEFFNSSAGLIAALLYSVSPLVLRFSRSSWNPNLMPFFSLLTLYVLYRAIKKPHWKLFFVIGLLFGITMQLHYIEVFLGIIIFIFFLIGTWIQEKKNSFINIFKRGLLVISGFLISMSPFLAFEIKNGFPNIRTIFSFIFSSNTESGYETGGTFLSTITTVFIRVFGALLLRFPESKDFGKYTSGLLNFWELVIILLALLSLIYLFRNKNRLVILLLSLWCFLGIFFFGFYKKAIYDYYYGFLFPLPFLLVGNLIAGSFEPNKKLFTRVLSIIVIIFLVAFNLYGNPFRNEPNRVKDQTEKISEFVLNKTGGEPYNFALMADNNSDYGYRYFFEIAKRAPVTIENSQNDPKRQTVTKQLFVVCEKQSCNPLGNPLFEIAGFGPATIVKEWDVSVVKVYKLIHAEN